MKALIVYFSGTGNTKWVIRTVKTMMERNSHSVILMDIEKPDSSLLSDPGDYDIVGLAHPVYGASMPAIVSRFLSDYPALRERIRLVITTFGYVNGFGYFAARKAINQDIRWYVNIRMFNNVTTPSVRGRVPDTAERREGKASIEKDIRKKIDLLFPPAGASAEISGRHIDGIAPYLMAGAFIRRAMRNRLKEHYRSLGVDMNRCRRCLRCVLDCPTASIQESGDNFVFLETCTACMRCYNTCPENAITVDGVYAGPVDYPRYLGPWGKEFLVTEDRDSDYPDPVRLRKGTEVGLGRMCDREGWEKWIECLCAGKKGWAPVQIFERTGEGSGRALEDYDATELSVRRGDIFVMERELNGWYHGFLSREPDRKGWVPKENLRKSG